MLDPGLGTPHHSAYVVESIEATVERLAEQLGAGPFFLIENVPLEDVTSRGEPARFEHDSAFGSCGGYPIELLQVAQTAPERVEARLSGPWPRIHHVGYALAPDAAEEARERFEERGLEGYLSSRLNGEYMTVHDASATLGHDIEILSTPRCSGTSSGWSTLQPRDGTAPIRYARWAER